MNLPASFFDIGAYAWILFKGYPPNAGISFEINGLESLDIGHQQAEKCPALDG